MLQFNLFVKFQRKSFLFFSKVKTKIGSQSVSFLAQQKTLYIQQKYKLTVLLIKLPIKYFPMENVLKVSFNVLNSLLCAFHISELFEAVCMLYFSLVSLQRI